MNTVPCQNVWPQQEVPTYLLFLPTMPPKMHSGIVTRAHSTRITTMVPKGSAAVVCRAESQLNSSQSAVRTGSIEARRPCEALQRAALVHAAIRLHPIVGHPRPLVWQMACWEHHCSLSSPQKTQPCHLESCSLRGLWPPRLWCHMPLEFDAAAACAQSSTSTQSSPHPVDPGNGIVEAEHEEEGPTEDHTGQQDVAYPVLPLPGACHTLASVRACCWHPSDVHDLVPLHAVFIEAKQVHAGLKQASPVPESGTGDTW